jgi:hypothetical protein
MVRVNSRLEEEDCFGEGAETSTRGGCAPPIRVIRSLPAVAGNLRFISCTLVSREGAGAAPILLLPLRDGAATRLA